MSEAPRPYTLVAELTHRCPLRCAYCSNPLELAAADAELGAETWARVAREAEALGVVSACLTGGEPLLRQDLEQIAAAAREAGLYVNLITSGIPLTRARLRRLQEAGVDSVQLSIQDASREACDCMAGGRSFDRKLAAARWVTDLGLPLTLNVVLQRSNIDRISDFVTLAETLGAERLELANVQYLGWAFLNREALLPEHSRVERARREAEAARLRLRGRLEVVFVVPDYHSELPAACMDGWARRFVVVDPSGRVLPCHAARCIPGLHFDSVRDGSLEMIWRDSTALRAFRGLDWMKGACRTCDRRELDRGGCRCQAWLLAGDPAAPDPACALSADHGLVKLARAAAEGTIGQALRPRARAPRHESGRPYGEPAL